MFKKLKQRLQNQKGLTLVELLAVIVILGIIAAIAVPSIGNIIEKSRADAIKAEAVQTINAAKLYVAAKGVPTDNNMDSTDLADYLDTNSNTLTNVVVTSTNNDLTISATGSKGNVSITFTNASIQQINNAESKSGITIGTE